MPAAPNPDAPRLEFWFEFASTYSWLAAARIGEAARRARVAVVWRPFLLGVFFKGRGLDTSPFNVEPEKGRHMWRDIERRAAGLGLPFAWPGGAPAGESFPRNGLLAARVMTAARDEPWAPAFARAVYAAEFVRGEDIAEPAVLAAALTDAGAEPERWLEAAGRQETKDALKAATAEALEKGIFGAPSFIAAGELFWGDDRLEEALLWAKGAHPLQLG